MPLPANKHLCVLSQEKMESLSGQISQLKNLSTSICRIVGRGPRGIKLGVNKQSLSICQNLPELVPVSLLMNIHTLRLTSPLLLQRIRGARPHLKVGSTIHYLPLYLKLPGNPGLLSGQR